VKTGDAFGDALRAAYHEETGLGPVPTVGGRHRRPVIDFVERDDGFVSGAPVARYLAPVGEWFDVERRALDRITGRTLDIGVGAGRLALVLQDRGVDVTGLDVSPGAVEVAAARGVRRTVHATVDRHARHGGRYDTFALYGNNLGLLESPARAREFLAALAAMANPGARVVGQGTDPYATGDPAHLAYQERNRSLGLMPGSLLVRIRYREVATEWFRYLLCSPAELVTLVAGTGWEVADLDTGDTPFYVAELRRSR